MIVVDAELLSGFSSSLPVISAVAVSVCFFVGASISVLISLVRLALAPEARSAKSAVPIVASPMFRVKGPAKV